mgnify:CR=1 FL=1
MSETARLILDNQEIELPVITGSENEKALDISKLRATTGYITLDPGFKNTGSTQSSITFLNGEQGILKIFPNATILRPSIVYSSSDNFSCNLMTLLSRLPIFPLYYYGKTKFTPIHCSDLTDIINFVISKKVNSNVIECIGPEVLTFKEILTILLNKINKKRLLIPFPLSLAMMTAKLFQLLPNPLLTVDQLKLLNYDNVVSGKYKTNFDIGVPAKKIFSNEIEKYSYMWREGGEYSKKKGDIN